MNIIIPFVLLGIIIFGSYKLGVTIERMRANNIPIWRWATWFKAHPEEK